MKINAIHSYLVHPRKHEEEELPIRGTSVDRSGRLFGMLKEIYERADAECNIEIVFESEEGVQKNRCRDLVVAYANKSTLAAGRKIAARLQSVTTHRSGLGLLFLMNGHHGSDHRLVIPRFPADQGILAHEGAGQLTVEFLERVFMKSETAYKSALYSHPSTSSGFWDGLAVDRQVHSARELSDYWIREFLLSDFRTTGAAGTRRIAVALRDAVRNAPSVSTKEELISAVHLLRGRAGKSISGSGLVGELGLSDEAAATLQKSFGREELYQDRFRLDPQELARHVPFRSVELDTGALLMGEEASFENIFKREMLNVAETWVRYSTEGTIVDHRLRKNK